MKSAGAVRSEGPPWATNMVARAEISTPEEPYVDEIAGHEVYFTRCRPRGICLTCWTPGESTPVHTSVCDYTIKHISS